MGAVDSSYAYDGVATSEPLSTEATVGPTSSSDSASFRGVGLFALVLVMAVELAWMGFLLFAVAHIA